VSCTHWACRKLQNSRRVLLPDVLRCGSLQQACCAAALSNMHDAPWHTCLQHQQEAQAKRSYAVQQPLRCAQAGAAARTPACAMCLLTVAFAQPV
jgi:hypothetical protein